MAAGTMQEICRKTRYSLCDLSKAQDRIEEVKVKNGIRLNDRYLMLIRPCLTRIPDQTVIVPEPSREIDRIQVTHHGWLGQNVAT